MKPTRQRILDYLASRPAATASELSLALQVTPSDVRHHLGILSDTGVIVPIGKRRIKGRGRPAQRFCLASRESEGKFDQLSSALLDESLNGLKPAGREAFLRRIAARLAGKSSQPVLGTTQGELHSSGEEPSARHHPSSLSVRLVRAIQRLSELGYHSRWEAHREFPRLILESNPFGTLSTHHPELFQLEVYLLEALLGVPITRITRPEQEATGQAYRVFEVGK